MTTVLPTTADSGPGPAYWVAGSNANTKQYIMKAAVYNATSSVPFTVNFPNQVGKVATLTVLTAPDPYSSNVLNGKNQVISTVTNINVYGGSYTFNLPNWSVALLTSPM
jgi:alpha-L-arabinofuranosidase